MSKEDDLRNAYQKIGEGFIQLANAMGIAPVQPGLSLQDELELKKTIVTFTCPLCKGKMTLRKSRQTGDRFAGCVAYPDCTGTRNLDGTNSSKKEKYKQSLNSQSLNSPEPGDEFNGGIPF